MANAGVSSLQRAARAAKARIPWFDLTVLQASTSSAPTGTAFYTAVYAQQTTCSWSLSGCSLRAFSSTHATQPSGLPFTLHRNFSGCAAAHLAEPQPALTEPALADGNPLHEPPAGSGRADTLRPKERAAPPAGQEASNPSGSSVGRAATAVSPPAPSPSAADPALASQEKIPAPSSTSDSDSAAQSGPGLTSEVGAPLGASHASSDHAGPAQHEPGHDPRLGKATSVLAKARAGAEAEGPPELLLSASADGTRKAKKLELPRGVDLTRNRRAKPRGFTKGVPIELGIAGPARGDRREAPDTVQFQATGFAMKEIKRVVHELKTLAEMDDQTAMRVLSRVSEFERRNKDEVTSKVPQWQLTAFPTVQQLRAVLEFLQGLGLQGKGLKKCLVRHPELLLYNPEHMQAKLSILMESLLPALPPSSGMEADLKASQAALKRVLTAWPQLLTMDSRELSSTLELLSRPPLQLSPAEMMSIVVKHPQVLMQPADELESKLESLREASGLGEQELRQLLLRDASVMYAPKENAQQVLSFLCTVTAGDKEAVRQLILGDPAVLTRDTGVLTLRYNFLQEVMGEGVPALLKYPKYLAHSLTMSVGPRVDLLEASGARERFSTQLGDRSGWDLPAIFWKSENELCTEAGVELGTLDVTRAQWQKGAGAAWVRAERKALRLAKMKLERTDMVF